MLAVLPCGYFKLYFNEIPQGSKEKGARGA